ncbi:MAG: aminotransferase class I/II-fold pyridoxal phosphate-dependent enzyme [Rhodothermales bacterium]|nr:aminotransferase class I/II-fold pyridoxal phosphate-dependent enzyme [Rhodothermales bacterium]
MIDLRSDTVTIPDEGMRQAMHDAEVGDDVFGEDPTVNELQKRVADILGKESSLFVPSGQMGNQLAIKVHTSPGDEVILAENCHIIHYESGASGAISGVQLSAVPVNNEGYPEARWIEARDRAGAYWEPLPSLVALENTINRASGRIFPQAEVQEIVGVAQAHGLKIHLDGARLWNASVGSGKSMSQLASGFDTVTVCLSKGLGAPVGSVLAGDAATISKAHRYRKMLGSGMRQVGFLAAAGLYAIDNNFRRLADDHANARYLAQRLASIDGIRLDVDAVQTNILVFELTSVKPEDLVEALKRESVLMIKFGPNLIRATTHLGVSRDDIAKAADAVEMILQSA